MSIDAGARSYLVSNPGVAALVAPGSVVCGGELPEEASYPAIVILSEDYPEPTMNGPPTIMRTILRISVLAADSETENGLAIVKAAASAVVKALHYFRGEWDGVPVKGAFLEQQEDIVPDEETGIVGVGLDFTVWHRPVP